jgi:hypothetical protein
VSNVVPDRGVEETAIVDISIGGRSSGFDGVAVELSEVVRVEAREGELRDIARFSAGVLRIARASTRWRERH